MNNSLFHSTYAVWASKNVGFDMNQCNVYLKLETWEEGVTGLRAFREGDEGIRVREWGELKRGLEGAWAEGTAIEHRHWQAHARGN